MTAGLVLGWFLVLRPTTFGGPAGYALVSGTSMLPTFEADDLVITLRQDQYAPGDVILFTVGDARVIHRIVDEDPDGGFRTRGDNNRADDGFRAMSESIVGKAWISLPGVGRWVLFIRQPLPLAICAWGFTTYLLMSRWRPRRPISAGDA